MPLGKFAALDVFLGRPPKGSFVAHEELHVVQMKKFGHIETENVIVSEEVMGEFQCELGLAYACRSKKQKRSKRFFDWI